MGVPRFGGLPGGINLAAGRPGVMGCGGQNAFGPRALFGGVQASMGLSFGANLGLGPVGAGAGAMVGGASLFAQAGMGVFV